MKLTSAIRFANKNIQDAFYKLEQGDDSEREFELNRINVTFVSV